MTVGRTDYSEAIVVTMISCSPEDERFTEFVLGRKYNHLTGKVTLADDSKVTKPVGLVMDLDGTRLQRQNITTTMSEVNADLRNVNRIRFEFTVPDNSCAGPIRIAFVGLTANP